MTQRFVFCAAVALLSTGCDILDVLGGADRSGARELRHSPGRPAWSADGSVIYFTDRAGPQRTSFTLNSIEPGSGRTRRLATLTGYNTGGEQARTVADPNVVYFAIANPDGSLHYTIYRVPVGGGALDTLTKRVSWPWFVISASGNRVAYRGPTTLADTVHVLTLTNGQPGATVAIPSAGRAANALGISPDGSTVVYHTDSAVYSVPAAGGPRSLLWQRRAAMFSDSADIIAEQLQWVGGIPHLLVATSTSDNSNKTASIQDVDGATGARTLLGTIPRALRNPWSLARSPDGQSFAAWVPVAIVRNNVEGNTYRLHMYVQTPRTNGLKAMLEWDARETVSWLEFSPDGRWLGLLLENRMYVIALPR